MHGGVYSYYIMYPRIKTKEKYTKILIEAQKWFLDVEIIDDDLNFIFYFLFFYFCFLQ